MNETAIIIIGMSIMSILLYFILKYCSDGIADSL
jgi:hypothetical protein